MLRAARGLATDIFGRCGARGDEPRTIFYACDGRRRQHGRAAAAFDQVREELRADFSPDVYKSWLEGMEFAGYVDNMIYLRTPNTIARDWVRQNAQHVVEARMGRRLQAPSPITVEAVAQMPAALQTVEPSKARPQQRPIGPAAPLLHTFENYCTGEANRAAVNAARAIAEGNGKDVFSLVLLTARTAPVRPICSRRSPPRPRNASLRAFG